MIVDFRRTRDKPNTVSIQGEEVEVEENRCLEVYLDSRLGWKYNTEAVFRKGQNLSPSQRLSLFISSLDQDV